MMNKFKFLLSLAVILSVFACGEVEEKLPEGTISDSEGLIIDLEWTTGGSNNQSLEDTDLELYLMDGDEEIDGDYFFSDFRQVMIEPHYADRNYTIVVEVGFHIDADTDYTLYVRGAEGSGETMTFTGSFSSTDKEAFIEHLEIQKSGDEYAITDL
jgi:hypothetical protein